MKISVRFCVALAVLPAAGCATTPAGRIKRDAALFETFPPQIQEKVREGKVELGYTPPMVYMALGRAARVFRRVTEERETIIWSYSRVRYAPASYPVQSVGWYRDRRGKLHPVVDHAWVDVGHYSEYETLRVEFKDDKVVAMETLAPP